jgi:hypothetical protein
VRRWESSKTIRPCVDCGKVCWGKRCRPCHLVATAARPRPALQNSWAERRRRAKVVAEWIEYNGMLCPGWGRSEHPVAKLTADHDWPVGAGGPESGPLGVLCPSCNSRKRDKTVDPRMPGRARGDRAW